MGLEDGRLFIGLATLAADIWTNVGMGSLMVVACRCLSEPFFASGKAACCRACSSVSDRMCCKQLAQTKTSTAHSANKLRLSWFTHAAIYVTGRLFGIQQLNVISGHLHWFSFVHKLEMFCQRSGTCKTTTTYITNSVYASGKNC